MDEDHAQARSGTPVSGGGRGWALFIGVVALLAAVLAVAAARDTDEGGIGGRAVPPVSVPDAAGPGEVPEVAGVDPITGRRVSLVDFRGRPVMAVVWASWCTECQAEAEDVQAFAAAHPEVAVVGIDIRDDERLARRFYQRYGWTFPSISDPDATRMTALGAPGQPTSVFLDPEGRVVGRQIGRATRADFERGLARATAVAPT